MTGREADPDRARVAERDYSELDAILTDGNPHDKGCRYWNEYCTEYDCTCGRLQEVMRYTDAILANPDVVLRALGFTSYESVRGTEAFRPKVTG